MADQFEKTKPTPAAPKIDVRTFTDPNKTQPIDQRKLQERLEEKNGETIRQNVAIELLKTANQYQRRSIIALSTSMGIGFTTICASVGFIFTNTPSEPVFIGLMVGYGLFAGVAGFAAASREAAIGLKKRSREIFYNLNNAK